MDPYLYLQSKLGEIKLLALLEIFSISLMLSDFAELEVFQIFGF
jgi:hypothetical protein